MALDHRQAAQEILDAIGGPGNVVSAAHCATRLRLVIADDAKVDQAAVDNAAGAKGNFKASGQLQVIYGTGTVNKVYDEFIALGNITAASKEEAKAAAAAQQTNPVMRAIKLLGDVFVPIIPAIVASGLLLGIMSALSFMDTNGFITLATDNAWYQILNLVSNTAFTFLQILIGFSAAKAFGANPYLGAVIGMLLINPGLQNAHTVAAEGVQQTYAVIPGLYSIEWTGYQGHVIPIVIACGILAFIEKRLHKVVPEAFDLFVTPLVSVAVTAYVTMLAVGPVFVWAENAILGGIQFLITLPLGIGSLIMGALYAPTVVTGLHQMYTTIDLGQLATYGVTYWLPLASAANIGQAGAALAVALKTKDVKVRSLALPSSLSAFMGITEPAIFGVNLRFFKPFVAGCVGGGLGAMFASIVSLGANGTGVTGIFGILLCLDQPLQYLVMFAISGAVAFAVSYALYKDPEAAQAAPAEQAAPVVTVTVSAPVADAADAAARSAAAVDAAVAALSGAESAPAHEVLLAPMTGEAIAMTDVPDPVFASEAMGGGAAVRPTVGELRAPAAGTVTVLAETGHALGMATDAGAEVLMHIGIDTVNLAGAPFSPRVAVGDHVEAGQLLMDVDLDAIRAAGLDPVTPLIVTNTDAYATLSPRVGTPVAAGEPLVELA